LIEILDGRKTIETPMMEIYLNEPYRSGKNIKELALQIKETRLGEIVKEFVIDLAENAVSFTLNDDKVKLVGVAPATVMKAIEKATKLAVKQDGKEFVVAVAGKDAGVNEVYKLKEMLRSVFISGIKNITQVLPVKRGDEYVIITAGTNLKTVMGMEAVDTVKTISNDIFEVADVLGIEAARATIINEIYKVIEGQGLNVDERHIMLVADMMTADGSIKGITRYGIIGEKSSVLARASFETPIRHLINAALIGEKDPLNSVVENVMINQIIPIGTGLPRIVMRPKEKK
jgi:DNA-directed RNA polymerase subunit A"